MPLFVPIEALPSWLKLCGMRDVVLWEKLKNGIKSRNVNIEGLKSQIGK